MRLIKDGFAFFTGRCGVMVRVFMDFEGREWIYLHLG
jgi:hypothetical protein